jgi:PadR family transcriptional regulator, regulatory protein AphA
MREQTTGYVILGVLAVGGDLSGYEIRQWVTQYVGMFWSESYGQIYPELKRLAKAGHIKALATEDEGRGKQRYRLSSAGRAHLNTWLQKAPKSEKPRIEILLKLFFGRVSGPDAARRFIETYGAAAAQRVEILNDIEKRILKDDATTPDLVYALLVASSGQFVHSARVAWAKRALTLLDAFEKGGNEAVLRAHKRLPRAPETEGA